MVAKSLHGLKAIAGELRESLLDGKIDDLGELLDRGWQQKKQLSNKISSDAIDNWYRLAREQGATGGKITGAGGGGFMLLHCEPDNHDAVRNALTAEGLNELTFGFDLKGVCEITEIERQTRELVGSHD